eukprot:CAMPEP_0201490514 /NCGR_PEP_ID=MMETSP0151_2-20130828/26606_1 /ASSEMBLY_ACC=CAM_ASM_000257 /TAXON_ID=200890 /ORGANISM="Paramoeba atlantica, Strain 621/1 / CCAP 1560/9" /LENGTH=167 /DNA_ID=CAMNT_0047876503 /DNA_START=173 /DNA_END=676 /DNA_ORIENTATION=+
MQIQEGDGDDPPPLISILKDEQMHEAFHQFAESQHCEENVMFWKAVEEYKEEEDNDLRRKKGVDVSEKFLKDGAPYEICCPFDIKNIVLERVDSGEADVFDALQDNVFTWTITEIYKGFLKSSQYYQALGLPDPNAREIEEEEDLSEEEQPTRKRKRVCSPCGTVEE